MRLDRRDGRPGRRTGLGLRFAASALLALVLGCAERAEDVVLTPMPLNEPVAKPGGLSVGARVTTVVDIGGGRCLDLGRLPEPWRVEVPVHREDKTVPAEEGKPIFKAVVLTARNDMLGIPAGPTAPASSRPARRSTSRSG